MSNTIRLLQERPQQFTQALDNLVSGLSSFSLVYGSKVVRGQKDESNGFFFLGRLLYRLRGQRTQKRDFVGQACQSFSPGKPCPSPVFFFQPIYLSLLRLTFRLQVLDEILDEPLLDLRVFVGRLAQLPR